MSDNHSSVERPSQSDPDAQKFAEVTSGIYRRFDPQSVWIALRYAVRHQLMAENPTIMLMFVRIAEVYPAAAELLKTQLAAADDQERQAIDLILNPPDEIRGAKYLPESIQSPGEMDLCWAEFLVTGKTDAVQRIVQLLDHDDHSRSFICEQLASEATDFELSETERNELQHFGIGIGKLSEDQRWEIMTPGDTDLFLWLGIKDQDPTCTRILKAMDDRLQLHLACKGAALWSLQANAAQHGTIRLLCEDAAKKPGGFGRTLLVHN